MKRVAILALLLLITNQPVAAMSGKQLLESCSRYSDEFKTGLCFGYIDGAMNVLLLNNTSGLLPSTFCLPKDVGIKELRKIVMSELRNSHKFQDKAAFPVVLNALLNNYPCL